ncbi:MAG: ATP-binding protein [Isosphaeraceae bacterium]
MTLTARFSAIFLAALGLALGVFSTALYLSARVYLDRRVHERLDAALAILAAAAEVHAGGIEWEPGQRSLRLGQESGADRLRWLVLNDRGKVIDRSANLDEDEALADGMVRAAGPVVGRDRVRVGEHERERERGRHHGRDAGRIADQQGGRWRVARRVLQPENGPDGQAMARKPDEPGESEEFAPYLVLVAVAPLGPNEATLATLGGMLVALSAAIWLAAAWLCRWLSRRALAPLAHLVASARGLDAADPGWSLALAGTGDELDDLGRAFNDLLGRLHVAFERQRRFSGDASHQLRTPLTVLIGQLQVALRYERSGDEYRRALASALGRAEQLARIVEALLFLSRAETESAIPGVEPIELERWVAEHLDGRAATDGAAPPVRFEPSGEELGIRAHPALLGQLLDNLLDNAAKYGRAAGAGAGIVVATRRDGDSAVLCVSDRGPGIAPEDLPHLFDPFYRSAQARRQGAAGVGLGLAIVRRIATASGGSVAVHSAPGAGATFEVRFPIAPAGPGEGDTAEVDPRPIAGVESSE